MVARGSPSLFRRGPWACRSRWGFGPSGSQRRCAPRFADTADVGGAKALSEGRAVSLWVL